MHHLEGTLSWVRSAARLQESTEQAGRKHLCDQSPEHGRAGMASPGCDGLGLTDDLSMLPSPSRMILRRWDSQVATEQQACIWGKPGVIL